MSDDWPDQVVADSLAAIVGNDTVVISKDYGSGCVRVRAGDHDALLTPPQAEKLADGYEDSRSGADLEHLQRKEVIQRLRQYASEVEPYHDDAAEE